MLVLGSGCKYRLSLAEGFDCTETIINQLLADSYQNPISKWQVKTSSGLPLILHYGELYNYFIIHYSVIIIEIKCTINVMHLNHPETIPTPPPPPGPWKNCLPRNRPLVPKRLGTTDLGCYLNGSGAVVIIGITPTIAIGRQVSRLWYHRPGFRSRPAILTLTLGRSPQFPFSEVETIYTPKSWKWKDVCMSLRREANYADNKV